MKVLNNPSKNNLVTIVISKWQVVDYSKLGKVLVISLGLNCVENVVSAWAAVVRG